MSAHAELPEPSPARLPDPVTATASNAEQPPPRSQDAASLARAAEWQKGLKAVIYRLSAMGVVDETVAIAAGYGEGNGNHNVHCMLRGASTNPERRLAKLQALADGSIRTGLASVIDELQAAGDSDETILEVAHHEVWDTLKESVGALARGSCKDAALKYERLEAEAAKYSLPRFKAIVDRLRQADWTNNDIALAAGHDDFRTDGEVETLCAGDSNNVQTRYTALRRAMHRVNQARRMRSVPRK
jgi:hypothetical protein